MKFYVYGLLPGESEKCDLDPKYTPRDALMFELEAPNYRAALKRVEDMKGSKGWICPQVTEERI